MVLGTNFQYRENLEIQGQQKLGNLEYNFFSVDRCFHRKKASGNITSPGFPHSYPEHSMCVWRVSARSAHHVHIKFDVMDIEPTRMCHFDYLEVRDGRHRTSPLIGRFCGHVKPRDIISSGR